MPCAVWQDTLRLVDKSNGDIISAPGTFSVVFTNGVNETLSAATVTLTGPQMACDPFPNPANSRRHRAVQA